MTQQERIKADAISYCKKTEAEYSQRSVNTYIAGAAAENERAQVLVDALEKAIATMKECELVYNVPCGNAIILCEQRLKEWKEGKQPDRPCPHCGKELSRDRNLCCRACGKEVEDKQLAEPLPDLGTCKECKTRPAVTDYNGHGYHVCQLCDNSLNRQFDKEYQ